MCIGREHGKIEVLDELLLFSTLKFSLYIFAKELYTKDT
jgi:hypothetical protein